MKTAKPDRLGLGIIKWGWRDVGSAWKTLRKCDTKGKKHNTRLLHSSWSGRKENVFYGCGHLNCDVSKEREMLKALERKWRINPVRILRGLEGMATGNNIRGRGALWFQSCSLFWYWDPSGSLVASMGSISEKHKTKYIELQRKQLCWNVIIKILFKSVSSNGKI